MLFATFISRLLDPLWVIPAVTMLGARRSGLEGLVLIRFLLVITIFMLGIPLVLRLLYRRNGDWDISQRVDRPKALAVLLVLGLINIALAAVWDIPGLTQLFVLYEVWMAGFLVISLFWKISGHAGGIALGTGLIILWYGWIWWPLLLLVPLMGWARVATKNHTTLQVLAGAVYSWGMIVMFQNVILGLDPRIHLTILPWIPAFAGMTGQ
ncbi:MAG: hypothetical protein AAB481_00850 [Patescibacteria group bacterium]